jgi:hypothetical protein
VVSFQQLQECGYGPFRGAALGGEGLGATASHGYAFVRIGYQFHENERHFRRADHTHGIVLLKQADDIPKIFVVVADENGNAVPGRLDDVVSTALHEAASNKCDITDLVERGEFADRIEKQYSSDDGLATPQRALPIPHTDALEQLHNVWKTFRMARSKDHYRFRMAGKDVAKCGEQKGFFRFERAATNKDGTCAGLDKVATQTFDDRKGRRRSNIKLEIAADLSSGRVSADFDQTTLVFFRLREEQIYVPENAREEGMEAAVSG